jgi:hypothetical protein
MESFPSDGDANVSPDSSIMLQFSEPLNTADIEGAFSLVGADEDTVLITMEPRDKFTLGGRPDPTFDYGEDYRLLIDAPRLSDAAGNIMSDSLIVIAFSTIGRDTLGQLSGEVQFSMAEDAVFPVTLSFNPAREGEPGGMTLLPGQTDFVASLIPGHYTVSGYLDRNRNGQYDYGSIIPYRLAEPFTTTVDTFRVRTRFESTGIVLQF